MSLGIWEKAAGLEILWFCAKESLEAASES